MQRMKSDGSARSCASDASRSSRSNQKVQIPPKPTAATGSTNVNKLFWLFTMLFLAIQHSMEILFAPEAEEPDDPNFDPASPKHRTCVLTDNGTYFCSEDEKEARRRARRTPEYYVTNFGVAQTVDGNGDENRKMMEVKRNMNNYMSNWIMNNSDDLCRQCQNKHDKCVFWASIGECSKNPSFMTTDCRLACQACEALKDADDKASES